MKILRGLVACFLILLIYLSAGSIPLFSQAEGRTDRLNFLLITIDTLRPDRLGCYSDLYLKTPNIDSLAKNGVLFSKAFAHTPTTFPSHTNILLGTTPLYHGVHDNHNFIVRDEFVTLAELLKDNGYSTAAFVGAFPLDSRFGLTQGFDVYDDNYGSKNSQEFSYVERKAEVVVDKACEWLNGRKTPWFLWVHCFDPHQRYDPPEPFKTEYKEHPYNGEIAYVDSVMGKLLDRVRLEEGDKNTLIIFTGDHGESLGEHGESTHGYFAYNSTLWVPLIFSFPGIKPGEVEQHACHIDIFPTVCDLLKIKKPDFLQGVSLAKAFKGKKLKKREIYFESLYPYYSRGWAPLRGMIYENKKFIDSPIPEFYNLEEDFNETGNLAASEKLDKQKKRLEKLVENLSYRGENKSERNVDRQTMEQLRSLGYLSSRQVSKKEDFSAADDLKTLLPFQNRLMKAMGAYHKGNLEEGENILKAIITERKDFDLAYAYLATLYKEQRRFKEAVEVLQAGYDNCPLSYKVITTFGIFLTEVGRYDTAISILEEGLKLIDYDPEIWNYLGVAHWKKGKLDEALAAFKKSLSLDKNYPIAFNNMGSVYLSKFLKTKERDAFQEALYHFKKAIELDPNYASAYNGLGAAYMQTGNIEGAIYCWEKAVQFDSGLSFALYNLGIAYLQKGEKQKALDALSKYKEINYSSLSPGEKAKLDDLIRKCRRAP